MDKYLSDKYNSNINSSEFTGWDKSRGRCESAGRDGSGDFDQLTNHEVSNGTDGLTGSEPIGFEWDAVKAVINVAKHGVDFREASTVFGDPYARIIDDPDHSIAEERFIIIGLSLQARLLTVCHCIRKKGQIIRIISAREATKSETKQYWRFYHAS